MRHIELIGTLFVASVVASPCCAQSVRASSIRANYWTGLRRLRSGPFSPRTSNCQGCEQAAHSTKSAPRLGKAFWIPWGLAIGLSVASTELTAHCVHTTGCSEANPIYGRRPTLGEMYAVKGGVDALAFYFSRKWKLDKNGDTFGWKALTYGVLSIQAADTAWDATVIATISPGPSAQHQGIVVPSKSSLPEGRSAQPLQGFRASTFP